MFHELNTNVRPIDLFFGVTNYPGYGCVLEAREWSHSTTCYWLDRKICKLFITCAHDGRTAQRRGEYETLVSNLWNIFEVTTERGLVRSCVTRLQEQKKSELEHQKLKGSGGLTRSHGEADSRNPHARSTPKFTPIVLSYPGYPGRRCQDVDTTEIVKQLLLEEMVARVIKIKIKAKLRVRRAFFFLSWVRGNLILLRLV